MRYFLKFADLNGNKGPNQVLFVGVFLLSILLQACGGGGGGGLGAQSVVYNGITTQAIVTEDNANTFYFLIFGEGASATSTLPVGVVVDLSAGPAYTVATRAGVSLYKRVKGIQAASDASGVVAAVEAIDETVHGAVSGTATISGEVAEDGTGDVTLTYTDFDEGDGEVLDGEMIMSVKQFDASYRVVTHSVITMPYLKVQIGSAGTAMTGSVDVKMDVDSLISTMTMNLDSQDIVTGRTTRLENFIITMEHADWYSVPARINSQSYNGRLYLDAEGYVDVHTESPITCADCYEFIPSQGGPVYIVGEGSRGKATFADFQRIRIEVDTDNDGYFDSAREYPWNDLSGEGEARAMPFSIGISADSMPLENITHGEVLSFQVVINNPGGQQDEVNPEYSMLYGPAGMQVNSSGQVTWLASGPMFETEIKVNWAVRASKPGETAEVIGTTTLKDPARQLPLVRSGIVVPAMAEGMVVADFDGDGKNELLVTDGRMLYTLEYDGSDYVQDWAYAFDLVPGGSITAIDAHDVDGDGRPEIFVGGRNKLVVLDGVSRKVVREARISFALVSSIEIADVDNDGNLEVVFLGRESSYSGNGAIHIADAKTLKSEWQSASVDYGSSLAIGELDGDAYPEIVVSKGYVYGYDGAAYRNEWVYSSGFGLLVDTGDTNNDGVEEIIGAVGAAVQAFDLQTKSIFWSTPARDLHSIKVVNIDNDAADEVLVGDGQWGNVTAYSYNATDKTVVADWWISSQDHSSSSITTGDVDNDNKVEIIWGTGTTSSGKDSLVVAGLNPAVEIEWRNINPSELDGPFYSAEWASIATEDSRALFVTPETDGGYSGARIVSMDENGQLDWSFELGSNYSGAGSLSAADYDLDGVDEVFLATSESNNGYFTVYDFVAGGAEWTSPSDLGKGVATSSGDLNNDGNEDFAVITHEGYVYAYDVVNSVVIWQSGYLGGVGYDIEILNMDDDPGLEIIIATTDKITILQKVLGGYGVKYETSLAGVNDIAVGDLNGDGRPEVVAIKSTYSDGVVTLLNSQLGKLAATALSSRVKAVFIEVSSSKRKNIILSLDSDSTDYWHQEGYLAWFDPFQGQEIARSPNLIGWLQKNSLNFIDVNSNGEYSLVFGTDYAMYMSR